jgi:hypothetical protein
MVPALRDIRWTRFWLPREGFLRLEPGGYFADPEGPYGKALNPDAVTLDTLASQPCLALLGEPGIGKSRALGDHADAVRARLPENERLLYKNLARNYDLEREIAGDPEFLI